jgi:pimeloyl-ACP methyl ester carboxylesterase
MLRVESFFFTSADGLKLHALAAGPQQSRGLPVICLAGLARTSEDFRELIEALAFDADTPRRVTALDARGRGRSNHDPNHANYSVPIELADVITLLEATGTERAIFIGTSRGGILTLALATVRRQVIAGAVLNDIGPVVEMAGLLRIKGYVGRLPAPRSYAEAAGILQRTMGTQFPAFGQADWTDFARRTWHDRSADGTLEPRYDRNLARALASVDAAQPPPALWQQFDALASTPLMVVRGEHSDILSPATVAAMRARRPDLDVLEVKGQGHAPLLTRGDTIEPIRAFAARCDSGRDADLKTASVPN